MYLLMQPVQFLPDRYLVKEHLGRIQKYHLPLQKAH